MCFCKKNYRIYRSKRRSLNAVKNCHGLVLVFSVSDSISFESLDYWVKQISENFEGFSSLKK